jgi:hypothetical protein
MSDGCYPVFTAQRLRNKKPPVSRGLGGKEALHPRSKPFSQFDEAVLKQRAASINPRSDNGVDHVGTDTQPNLSPISQVRPYGHSKPGRETVIEVISALFGFFSVGLFLAHAFDAYRVR